MMPIKENIDKDLGFPFNPKELKLEISRACQLRCEFCYLGKADSWQEDRFMPEENVLAWIDWAVDNNIPVVRFTGGEAILHPQIRLFCNYAYLQKRWIILNTNGMADQQEYDRLCFNNLRVSVPNLNPARLDEISGQSNVLTKKLALIEHTLMNRKKRVCMLTVLTPELIGRLEEFIKVLKEYPGLEWIPLRFESSPETLRPLTRDHMQALAEEMAELMGRFPTHAKGIYIAAPFCSVTPTSLGAKVFHGRVLNCGPYVALNVNFDSILDVCFGVCELPGKTDLQAVKKSAELAAACSLEALPEECQKCEYVQRCAGGCGKPAGLVNHNGKKIDYLAGFVAG